MIGNLYSRAGLNPMLRNILANPSIRYLVLTGRSLTDSDEALLDFFRKGVDQDWRVVGNGAQLDLALPLDALNDVRGGVELIDLRSSPDFENEFNNWTETLKPCDPFCQPRTFPKIPPRVRSLPSEFTGFVIRKRTIYEAWIEILRTVMMFGDISPTDYGLEQKELLALLSVIETPELHLETLPGWAPFKQYDVKNYVHNFLSAKNQVGIAYNYGYRLQSHWSEDQFKRILSELQRFGHSRRAVASLWDPREDSQSSDPVCLTTIQAVIRRERLHLMAYVRSNDMFRAYPLNAAALAGLQSSLTSKLEIETGPLEILSYSAHIYSDCWDACEQASAEALSLNRRFEQDPRGSFVFRTQDMELIAEHYSPLGDLLETFTSRTANGLMEMIAPLIGRVDHAMYLGREIERLASAIDKGHDYEQDKVGENRKV